MAIYFLDHSSIGKSTHAKRTAGTHVRYITRPSACADLLGERMPVDRLETRRWLDDREKSLRKNARVADKILIALPRELHPLQRAHLVKRFCEKLTQGVAPWFAAIHQTGSDKNNPHAHIVIHDWNLETGRKVIKLSSKGSTLRLRSLWGDEINFALTKLGRKEKLTHRRLKSQNSTVPSLKVRTYTSQAMCAN